VAYVLAIGTSNLKKEKEKGRERKGKREEKREEKRKEGIRNTYLTIK
jgi:hypothetical protein